LTEPGAEIDVILRLEIESLRFAPAARLYVVMLALADRHACVREVGYAQ